MKAREQAATPHPSTSSNSFLGIFLAAFLTVGSVLVAKAQTPARKLNPAERWVVEQVIAGKLAELSEKFPDEKDRKLSAPFLEDLLTGMPSGIKPLRIGVRIRSAIVDEHIDLTNAQIPWEVWLENGQFHRGVTFVHTHFTKGVSFSGSTFWGTANFERMKVEQIAFFRNAVFNGPAAFLLADIAANFEAQYAQFTSTGQGANFNSMKVGNVAFFRTAVFEGPVDFGGADFGAFEADGAQFKNKDHETSFNSMKVGNTAFFRKAVFNGPVDFGFADIGSGLEAEEAKFKDTNQGANFNTLKVANTAVFKHALFEGPVNFFAAQMAIFQADEAQFNNKQKTANFSGMKVDFALFRNARFQGPVDFGKVEVTGDFAANEAHFNFDKVNVASSHQGPEALYNEKQRVSFNAMKVLGAAFFSNAVFEGPVDFRYADFAWLNMSGVSWPKDARLDMQGMTYKYIRGAATNERESHEALLKLVKQLAYTADVYTQLEQFFLTQGNRDHADRVFIAGKRREREESFRRGEYLRWLGSWLLDYLVRYGRHPSRAGLFCAFFVGLGAVLFAPPKMELQKPDGSPRIYNRFWYSLGLFLPVVNLESDRVWKPKSDRTFLRNYMRVHILLGWILIPILLAALTGLIK